ncbi:flippase [Bacillus alveayuensis]|uniref:flippase n=1 Tax=Aeribacillus alveayuensis TaxID=279215 RepID=UPI0005CDA72C|nr:flippase [Bacillus alveayuensis]
MFKIDNITSLIVKKLSGNTTLQKIIANTGWLFFERIFRMMVSLFVGVWVARYLGPEQFGILNYANAYVTLFTALATLGLDGIVVRNIVRAPDKTYQILGTAFILKLIGGIFSSLLMIIIVYLIRPEDTLTITLVAVISIGMIFQSFSVIDFLFQSRIESKNTVYARSIAFILTSIIKVILILTNSSLIAFGLVSSLEILIGAIGLVIVYRLKGFLISKWKFSLNVAGNLLKDSWPLIFSGLAIMIYMKIDQIMLGDMIGEEEVGIYSVAVKISEMWYFIPMAIVNSTFPTIVNAKRISDQLFYDRLQKLYDIMAILGYFVAIPMTFLGTDVVKLLYGNEYLEAGSILTLYIWVGLFVNLGVARSSFLKTVNWTKIHFLTSILGCMVNVILNFILIPKYGALGATIASIISYWFQAHGACFLFPKMMETGKMLTKSLIAPVRFAKKIKLRISKRYQI